jgi:hypothetical protein
MQLSDEQIRVLGALVEKEMTVPETYPMSLNAVVTACNQTTNRWPVLQLTATTAEAALDALRTEHQLVRKLFAGAGSRTDKYRHVLDDRLGLSRPEKAVLAVLLLRGPQTTGELKGRTDRMHEFADLATVDAVLDRLGDPRLNADPEEPSDRRDHGALRSSGPTDPGAADRPADWARPWDGPLVVRLERQPGQKEARWAHTLGLTIPAAEPGPSPASAPAGSSPSARMAERVERLEADLAALQAEFEAFRRQF